MNTEGPLCPNLSSKLDSVSASLYVSTLITWTKLSPFTIVLDKLYLMSLSLLHFPT